MTFTPQQMKNFAAYVRVQKSLRYNMLDPRAAQAAGLDRDEMVFIMENYDALRKQAEQAVK